VSEASPDARVPRAGAKASSMCCRVPGDRGGRGPARH